MDDARSYWRWMCGGKGGPPSPGTDAVTSEEIPVGIGLDLAAELVQKAKRAGEAIFTCVDVGCKVELPLKDVSNASRVSGFCGKCLQRIGEAWGEKQTEASIKAAVEGAQEAAAMTRVIRDAPELKIGDLRPGHPEFYRILDEMGALHERKTADYGLGADVLANCRSSQDFGIPAWLGVAVRMNDKMTRIKALAQKGELKNEPVEDSFLDIACYAIIALILYREANKK